MHKLHKSHNENGGLFVVSAMAAIGYERSPRRRKNVGDACIEQGQATDIGGRGSGVGRTAHGVCLQLGAVGIRAGMHKMKL